MPSREIDLTSAALEKELYRIGQWWLDHAVDHDFGGFHGQINNAGEAVAGASKSLILNTRILWFFSEAFRQTQKPDYLHAAGRAFDYLMEHFLDEEKGGLFWEVDAEGKMLSGRKQTYGQAFGIYALSAYARITHDKRAADQAIALFEAIERVAVEKEHGGYLEAFSRDWTPIDDMRLSEVDANSPKSMNTHLHVLEAYSGLYALTKSPEVGAAMTRLLDIFADHIIDESGHMALFFSNDWTATSTTISCGHEIEASWLLLEAAQSLANPDILSWMKPLSRGMARRCLAEAWCDVGYIINELHNGTEPDLTSPWWVQAEALVGFLWSYRETGDDTFYAAARRIWSFIQEQHIDYEHGEWLWDARRDPVSSHRDYKAGAWKGPYHNGRAMLEGVRLMNLIERERATHGFNLSSMA